MTEPVKALSIRNLRKTYDSGLQAVKGIDLDIAAGDFFALLGPNGAGKSTTIGMISSLVNKTSGKISVFGHDLDKDTAAVKQCIGLVPQEVNFNQFEKAQDILLHQAGYYGISGKRARVQVEACLRNLKLWDKRDSVSRQLSGGMKRRLMIARALVHSPRLLILDEPTAGVDIEIRRSMWEFLKQINQSGTTIILTTHYLEEAENLCRNIAIINHGKIVEHTDMPSLLAKRQVDSFVLDLKRPLVAPPQLEHYPIKLSEKGTIMTVDVPTEHGLNGLFSALSAQGIEVASMRNQSNRLEQWFMNLVGDDES